ncbi:hypothetical protein D3C81_1198800 [compost metagenome]
MYGLADGNLGQVDFDEFRQILRQAGNFHFRHGVGDFATLQLHGISAFGVDEVQRYGSVQLVVGDDADEVGVQDEAFGRMALQGLDHDGFNLAVDVQGEHVAEHSLVFQQLGEILGQQADGQRSGFATVDHGRNQAGVATQAAARTFPQVGTRFGIQGKIVHCISPE